MDARLAEAAELFKVLGNESRLRLLLLIGRESRTVGALAEASGLSQPLVSQHLRTLRNAGLVAAQRSGKEVGYEITDLHVSHVVSDALEHVREPASAVADAEHSRQKSSQQGQ
jgi:DNA-binding transcriptional ArsR family regulator